MGHITPFEVEQYFDAHENWLTHNLAETCSSSLSLSSLTSLTSLTSAPSPLDPNLPLTYGHIRGSPALRSNIGTLYNPRLQSSQVLITAPGAIAANFLVLYTLLRPGDHVVCVYPTYQQLYEVPRSLGAEVELWRLEREDGKWTVDVGALEKLIRKPDAQGKGGTRLVIINNPNNPTGFVFPTNTLDAVVSLLAPHDIPLLSDEVYSPLFHSSPVAPSIVSLYTHGIVTGSLSKAWGLAGLRIGWIASQSKPLLESFAEARDYNTISVSLLDDQVASFALGHPTKPVLLSRNLDIARANLSVLEAWVQKWAQRGCVEWAGSQAGTTTLVWFKKKTESGWELVDDVDFCEKLQRKTGVMVAPAGKCFGQELRGAVRVGFCFEREKLKEGLEKVGVFLEAYCLGGDKGEEWDPEVLRLYQAWKGE